MKIIIFGGSGSGTTTLGSSLAKELGWVHLDADYFYWTITPIPYQIKTPIAERNRKFLAAFEANENVIVSGGVIGWKIGMEKRFDLIVFLKIPHELRMKRLLNRERERYGDGLETHEVIKQQSVEFVEWARQYDDPDFYSKNITRHERWMKMMPCPAVRLEGDLTVEERVNRVIITLKSM